ncbi:MAG TPA: SPOCS domain-containing protein [Symbiobacteriaceae bacterium]|nr:SPOCS domain-containing protein [Symbiobacteriaceae bacterium]
MAFEVEQVIGSGNVQELICQPITFQAPAEEVKEIRKTVIIDNCMVVFDKVIIDGRLRKDILFKQANAGFPLAGNVAACTGIIATVTGPVLDVDVDIAFNALIPVPGARPGDKCVVLQAFVEGEKEEAADINANGSFQTLVDKSIVFLCVKVTVSKRYGSSAIGLLRHVGRDGLVASLLRCISAIDEK